MEFEGRSDHAVHVFHGQRHARDLMVFQQGKINHHIAVLREDLRHLRGNFAE